MLDKGGGDCTHPPFTEAFYMQIYRIKISKSFINLITLYFNYSLCCNGCDICLMKVSKVHILKNHGTCCICEFFFKMWLSFIRSVISSHNKYCSLFKKRRLVFYRDVFFWFDKIWPILHGFFKIKIILISKAFIYKLKTTCKLKIRNYICLANPI